MHRHLNVALVQEKALKLMINLAFHSPELSQRMVDLGAVEHIIAAVEWHPTSPAVVVKGLGALKNLTHIQSGSDQVLAQGAHQMLVAQAVKPGSERVQTEAVCCLLNDTHNKEGLRAVRDAWADETNGHANSPQIFKELRESVTEPQLGKMLQQLEGELRE